MLLVFQKNIVGSLIFLPGIVCEKFGLYPYNILAFPGERG
jgi:hypothetical protein